ncbi:MAG: hypothetical protein U0176_15330 [Bacteroidia bacterium]
MLEDSTSATANIHAWGKHLGANVKPDHIRQAVYTLTLDELQNIRQQPNGNVAQGFSANALVTEWRMNRKLDVLDYLIVAKQAEPFCVFAYDPWSEAYEERPLEGIQEVIKAAKSGSKRVSEPYLKLRYAYQAVRLHQYAGQPNEAIETYQQLAVPFLSADALIGQWTMCHYAGCLRANELEAEAAYTFSRIFDVCPSRRIQAWYGWRINSDEIWDAVQAKCKNNHEMATVFFLRGFSSVADPMDDMRQMQELDPGNEMIEVLLIREINKIERDNMGYPYSGEKPIAQRFSAGATKDLMAFVNGVIASGKMHNRDVWTLAHIHLQYLSGQVSQALATLKEKQGSLSAEGQYRAHLLDLVYRIAETKTVDRSVENTIYKDFTNLKAKITEDEASQLANFRDDAFAWLYEAQGEKAKALLARSNAWSLNETPIDLDRVNQMIAFDAKADKTLYEKELLTRLGDEKNRKDYLLEIKGTALMARNLMPEALKVLQQISPEYRKTQPSMQLVADPFRTVTEHYINCENCGAGKFDKVSFLETFLNLEKIAATEPAKAMEAQVALGNAYFQTSYFGQAWNARDFNRSGISWGYLGEHDEWYDFKPETFEEIVDVHLAQEHFTKALSLAKDKEAAASIAFQIAKCELARSYMGEGADKDLFTGFRTIKEQYRKTSTAKSLMKECWFLNMYMSNR